MKLTSIDQLSFEKCSYAFEKGELIFDQFSWDVPLNEIVHLHSNRGEGKSTLLKMIAALDEPTSGEFYINGQKISEMAFEDLIPYRMKVGYSFDYGGLLNNRTVYENLILPLHYHKTCSAAEAKERVLYYINYFGLTKVRNERPAVISGSMRKEACVARAFVSNPEMLVLDDPSTGLNNDTKDKLIELIWQQKKEGTLKHVFVASEDLAFIDGFATVYYKIEHKKVEFNPVRIRKAA